MKTEQIIICADTLTIDASRIGHHIAGTDPPYSQHVHASVRKSIGSTRQTNVRHVDLGFASLSDELRAAVADAAHCAKAWSITYSDVEGVGAWRDALDVAKRHRHVRALRIVPGLTGREERGHFADDNDEYIGEIPWIRWGSPQSSDDRPPSCAESVVLGHSTEKMNWFGPRNLFALTHSRLPATQGEALAKHPTEKPLDQALDLVSWFSEPGDLWFDRTAGRGTFGVACAILGRNYIGVEQQSGEVSRGMDRIRDAQKGTLSRRYDKTRFDRWCADLAARGSVLLYRQDAPLPKRVKSFDGVVFDRGVLLT
jgi:hypothetical protein